MIALAVDLCNSVAVTLFGIALSAAFCNIHWTPKAKKRMLLYTLMIFCLSGIAYLGVDPGFGRYLYPLHTHLPLVLALCSLSHEPVAGDFWLTAYLCCQLRRWLALIAVAIFSGGDTMQYAVEIIVTVPMLILLLKAAPAIRSVSQYSRAVQCQFGIVPAVYYAFDYATRVYTDLLFSGSAVVVEFMPFVCSAAYLLFLIHISREQHARLRLEELKSNLDLQVHQAVREIEALRISQQKTRAYRHDLRHHLQYITACIENEQQAGAYIPHQRGNRSQPRDRLLRKRGRKPDSLIVCRPRQAQGILAVHAVLPNQLPLARRPACVPTLGECDSRMQRARGRHSRTHRGADIRKSRKVLPAGCQRLHAAGAVQPRRAGL
ncbi:MAG: hypothetical protein ACLRVN_06260 [Butyricicoccus sp.]